MEWVNYDPNWLIALAKEQLHAETWLPDAQEQCTRCLPSSETYIHFVSPVAPNTPDSEWQHDLCLELYSEIEECAVLDVLKNGRIGGIEFVDKL